MKEKLVKGDAIPFTQIANSVLSDPKLSMRAKGLYAYLYSKPDDWDFSSMRIRHECTDGKDAVQTTLRELIAAGLLERRRLPSGRMEYIIYVKPKSGNPAEGQKPVPERATEGKSHRGKIRHISNIESSTNKEKKVTLTASLNELVDYYLSLRTNDQLPQRVKRSHFPAAKSLLELSGSLEAAQKKVDEMKAWADSQGVNWSLETVIKRWGQNNDPKVKKKVPYIDGDPAFEKNGRWFVNTPNGIREWVGSIDKLEWREESG